MQLDNEQHLLKLRTVKSAHITRREFIATPFRKLRKATSAALATSLVVSSTESIDSVRLIRPIHAQEETPQNDPPSAPTDESAEPLAAPAILTAGPSNAFSEIPDFGNISPINTLNGQTQIRVAKSADGGSYETAIRPFDWFSDYKVELDFRFTSPTPDELSSAGIHFGIRPPHYTIQGAFVVRQGGPSKGEYKNQGDIIFGYQVKSGDSWSNTNHLAANHFGRMGLPREGRDGIHRLQLVCRNGILMPFYDGVLFDSKWVNHVDQGNQHPIKDPVGRGQVGLVVRNRPNQFTEVDVLRFRLVGTKVPVEG